MRSHRDRGRHSKSPDHTCPVHEQCRACGLGILKAVLSAFGMKHARSDALDSLEPLLREIRLVPGLVEKTRGVFCRNSQAFLHFHEDPSGMHADVRLGEEFTRYRAETEAEQQALLDLIRPVAS